MKRSVWWVVLSGSVLFGCANQHAYVQEKGDVLKHDADLMACKSAMSAYSDREEAQAAMDKCMADKGYEKVISKYGM
jgi:hypothetical protein